jgi:GNAT superfamily N-acetyltransferase
MIEVVNPENFDELLGLMRLYQEFYQVVSISEERNREFFAQFGSNSSLGCQFLYRHNNMAVGFATVYFSFSSTAVAKVGIMNDLYTLPASRGQGIGKALINHCLDYALNCGALRLQWTTALDNQIAQKLYDSLDASKKPWLFYTYRR